MYLFDTECLALHLLFVDCDICLAFYSQLNVFCAIFVARMSLQDYQGLCDVILKPESRSKADAVLQKVCFIATFLPARRYASAGISNLCCRRVSVCLSVTRRYCVKTAKLRMT